MSKKKTYQRLVGTDQKVTTSNKNYCNHSKQIAGTVCPSIIVTNIDNGPDLTKLE